MATTIHPYDADNVEVRGLTIPIRTFERLLAVQLRLKEAHDAGQRYAPDGWPVQAYDGIGDLIGACLDAALPIFEDVEFEEAS